MPKTDARHTSTLAGGLRGPLMPCAPLPLPCSETHYRQAGIHDKKKNARRVTIVWLLCSCFLRNCETLAMLPVVGPHTQMSCESTFCPDHKIRLNSKSRCQSPVLSRQTLPKRNRYRYTHRQTSTSTSMRI